MCPGWRPPHPPCTPPENNVVFYNSDAERAGPFFGSSGKPAPLVPDFGIHEKEERNIENGKSFAVLGKVKLITFFHILGTNVIYKLSLI